MPVRLRRGPPFRPSPRPGVRHPAEAVAGRSPLASPLSVRRLALMATTSRSSSYSSATNRGPSTSRNLLIGKEADGGPSHAKAVVAGGILEQHAEHLERNDSPSPSAFACGLGVVEPRRLGDDGELASQRERIERAHVLVEIHAHAMARGLHADPDVGKDDRVLQRLQAFGETPLQRRRSLGARYRRRAPQHLGAVALDQPRSVTGRPRSAIEARRQNARGRTPSGGRRPRRPQWRTGTPRRRPPAFCGGCPGLRRASFHRPTSHQPPHALSADHRCGPGPAAPCPRAVCAGCRRQFRIVSAQVAAETAPPTCPASGWRQGKRPRTRR